MNKLNKILPVLFFRKYLIVRIVAGLFGCHFFFFYLKLLETVYLFRSKETPTWLNEVLNYLGQTSSLALLRVMLVFLILCSLFFVFGRLVRVSALLMWFGYTFFYNFFICINQPHITYYLYILISFVIFSEESLNLQSRRSGSFKWGFVGILSFVYMYQMSISGFSKALSPEWRNGDVVRILSLVRDPGPGILWVGELPNLILRWSTWSVLAIECFSFLYILMPAVRFGIWTMHILIYLFILLMVPHATHVAFVMLLFNFFILDPKILPKKWVSLVN